jgi:hypothetical protein
LAGTSCRAALLGVDAVKNDEEACAITPPRGGRAWQA